MSGSIGTSKNEIIKRPMGKPELSILIKQIEVITYKGMVRRNSQLVENRPSLMASVRDEIE
ncbi:hypothetical protein IKF92_00015 [Candidatus Saccharibacteria bacterium]|nr:hypothetical protein [Candidatus Saccharibacteria bacterium]